MVRRFSTALCVMVLCGSAVMGQNARLNALGGNPILTDFTNVLYDPAYMCDYPDAVQATYDGGVGPLLGVKNLGKVLKLGLTFDQARVLDGLNATVYDNPGFLAALDMDPRLTGEVTTADIDPMPHLLVGTDFGVVKTGLDLYWERASYKYEEKNVNRAAGVTTTTKASGKFNHLGFNLGVHVDLDAFLGAVTFGMGLPRISGSSTVETTGLPTDENKAESDKGLALNASAAGYFTMLNLDWMAAVYAGMMSYKGRYVPGEGAPDVVLDEFFTGGIGATLGFERNLKEHGIHLALTETVEMLTDKTVRETVVYPGTVDLADNSLDFLTVASVEKTWSDLKRLDVVQGRCALTYYDNVAIAHRDGEDANGSITSRERTPAVRTGFNMLLGGGIGKGILQLDAQVDMGAVLDAISWSTGNRAGNDLVCVTLTLDFGKLGSSGRTGKARSSEMAPAPAAQTDSGLPF